MTRKKMVWGVLGFSVLMLSGCIPCPPDWWTLPRPPGCPAPSIPTETVFAATAAAPSVPSPESTATPLPILENVIFKIAVPDGTSEVELILADRTVPMDQDGVIFLAVVESARQGEPFHYRVDGRETAEEQTAQVNYSFLKGEEDISSLMRSATFGGMILTRNSFDEWERSLLEVKRFGFSSITIVPDWFVVPDSRGTSIEPMYPGDSRFTNTSGWIAPTLPDEDLVRLIVAARALDLDVILKPHVDPIDFGVTPGSSRGALHPADWEAWMASYRAFLLHYAELAEDQRVELLFIGTELDTSAQRNGRNPNATRDWKGLIADVRAVYSGRLGYSVSCYGDCSSPSSIGFWEDLDVIGLEPYFGLTSKLDPTVAEMRTAFSAKLDRYAKTLADRYRKPVILSEVNVFSFDGVNGDPINGSLVPQRPLDPEEQANYYEAFFQAAVEKPYIEGYILWAWYIDSTLGGLDWGLTDGYDPFANKIAGQVVMKWQR